MPPAKQQQPKSVLHELLDWSANRPSWQRDALRRIVVVGKLDSTDIKELGALCRTKHDVNVSETAAKAQPLEALHLPTASDSEKPVTLKSIGALKGVNRLPPSQVVPFGGSPGLTVIYGDNGSGKSGYARVLKKACRSRGASPVIQPDAFASPPSSPATASIVFQVGDKEQTITWTDNAASDARLSNVFIFDGSTAGNYLEQEGPASFTPYGLDILPKLSKTCDAVKDGLKQEIDLINTEIASTKKNWIVDPATSVGKMISGLGSKTKDEDVNALAGLNEAETKRLKELSDLLRTNSKQKAKETRAAAERLTAFAVLLKAATNNFSETEISALKKCLEEANTTAEAAKAFASGRFDSSHLTGTGEDFWRKLWEAAREYSELAAYKDKEFPATADDAKCLLCQQPVKADAAERLKAFQVFYTDKSQQLAKEAAQKLKAAKDKIDRLASLENDHKKTEADLSDATAEQLLVIKTFVTTSDEILKTLKENLSKGVWNSITNLPPSPEKLVTELASKLQARAKEEDGADDPVARKKLESERDELTGREWLGKTKADVLAQIARHKKISILELCQKDTATASVTSKNAELTKQLVTDAFCERFKTELDELGLQTIGVKLQDIRGSKGETKFGLRLNPASTLAVHEVASEGEQRCIALAAFLAELSQAGHKSALVFDDPVSSLDHWHRERIACRLVKESKTRQVVVFTHDAVFLNDLCAQVEENSASGTYSHLAWNGSEPGHCYDGLPWDCKSPEDRLDKLEKMCGEITKTWGPKPSEKNIAEMRGAYSWLRQTLERMVEKVVFADVVFRYRSYVNMKQLKRAVGFTQSECDEIDRLFKRCCDVTDSHDAAQGKQATIPDPAALKKDIDATKTLLSGIRSRQKAPVGGASASTSTAP
jgi:energy-coupling factor transporter ATP-binding protein EcfA2